MGMVGRGGLKEHRGNNSETMENKPGSGVGRDQAGVRTEVHAVGVQREGYKWSNRIGGQGESVLLNMV